MRDVSIASRIQDLTGKGVEYLIDEDGNVIAKFINGQMPEWVQAADEPTKSAGRALVDWVTFVAVATTLVSLYV
jgi:hypothetical protein